jgi:outer membrane immunogenic protein
MRKILLSSVALFGFTAGALAADLPVRAAPPVFAAPVPVFTWTGFYVGVNAGFAWSGDRDRDNWWGWGAAPNHTVVDAAGVVRNVTYTALPAGFGTNVWNWDRDRRSDGRFTGGAQVGFNWQMTPGAGLVVGVEADINWLGGGRNRDNNWWGMNTGGLATAVPVLPAGVGAGILPGTGAVGVGAANVFLFNEQNTSILDRGTSNWYATVRGRLGWGFDRMLIYATGGLAFADRGRDNDWLGFGGVGAPPAGFYVGALHAGAGQNVVNAAGATPGWGAGRGGRNNVGWTIGGGVEWAFTNNLTVKLEALYVDLDNGGRRNDWWGVGTTNRIVGVANTGAAINDNTWRGGWGNNRSNDDFFVVRAGINFKFGS